MSGPPRFDGRRVDGARLVSIFSVLKLPWGGRRVPVAGLRLCTCQFLTSFLLGSIGVADGEADAPADDERADAAPVLRSLYGHANERPLHDVRAGHDVLADLLPRRRELGRRGAHGPDEGRLEF